MKVFFSKRRIAWESVNKYLLQEGWSAITEKARLRLPPIGIDLDVTPLNELDALPAKEQAYLIVRDVNKLKDRCYMGIAPPEKTANYDESWDSDFIEKNYRYQRRA